jgi:hypothetical protein
MGMRLSAYVEDGGQMCGTFNGEIITRKVHDVWGVSAQLTPAAGSGMAVSPPRQEIGTVVKEDGNDWPEENQLHVDIDGHLGEIVEQVDVGSETYPETFKVCPQFGHFLLVPLVTPRRFLAPGARI